MSSKVWKYFSTILPGKDVKCKLCLTVLVRKDTSTKTMWDHLKLKHKTEHDLIKETSSETNSKVS
jgi:hypothetical protein